MSIFTKFFKSRGLAINLLASACFIFMAVYGWGLTWREVWEFFVVLVAVIGSLIFVAFGLGWLLRVIKSALKK
jgi:hypothetical protein